MSVKAVGSNGWIHNGVSRESMLTLISRDNTKLLMGICQSRFSWIVKVESYVLKS